MLLSAMTITRWGVAGLACTIGMVVAQRPPGTKVLQVWGAVVVQTYGDRTPLLAPEDKFLTPLGAQQLYESGSFYRQRYVGGPDTSIPGLPDKQLNNSLLEVWTDSMPWNQQSAQAFYSGFYPPTTEQDSVGQNDTSSVFANGTTIQTPLNGIQYPSINTPSTQDPGSFLYSGISQCATYYEEVDQWLNSSSVQQRNATTLQFYSGLADVIGTSSASILNYGNAYEIWDLLNYQVTHNQHAASSYGDSLTQARQLADSYVASTLANASSSILTIAGRSIASPIMDTLAANIAKSGGKSKLSTFFVGYEPFLSFVAMLGMKAKDPDLVALPNLGASFVIELYSEGIVQSQGDIIDSYPKDLSDLYVRLYSRDSPGANLTSHNLTTIRSTSGDGGGVQYLDFYRSLESWLVGDPATWCSICKSSAVYCPYFLEDSPISGAPPVVIESHSINPVEAGVIGAMVTLALLLLVLLVSTLFLGFRIRRESSGLLVAKSKVSGWRPGATANGRRRSSGLGGFKGDEKLASDIDLPRGALVAGHSNTYAHQRSGSWELKNNKQGVSNEDNPETVSPNAGIRIIKRGEEEEEEDLGNMKAVETRESV